MFGMTTIRILRGRVNLLMHENGVLRRENERLRQIADAAGVRPRSRTPDYGLGSHEFVDPISGIDTWGGAEGAD